ncbi:MAG: hypothetical protein ABI165_09550 [Bryobacteraceae bacterium]
MPFHDLHIVCPADLLGQAGGREVRDDCESQLLEGLRVFVLEDDLPAGETVFEGVVFGSFFTGFGFGAGRELGIGAVGVE